MAHLKWIVYFSMFLFTLVLMGWYTSKNKQAQIKAEEEIDLMIFYKQEPIYKHNFLFTLREKLKCEDIKPFLVILVTSSPTDQEPRQAIRDSWGSQTSWSTNQVLIFFLLGQINDDTSSLSIKEESFIYGDIIQQNFQDTYYNLTLKTIMAFRWVNEFCSSAQFVMKTDSDVFINTGNLVNYLENFKAAKNFITGYPLLGGRCFRDIQSKAYITYEEYPYETFPPYLSGLGYVLDATLAHNIYAIMAHVKPIKFEDVYVGICLGLLHVDITLPKNKELFFFSKNDFDICKLKHLIAVHKVTSEEMISFWDLITRDFLLPCQ